MAPKISTRSTPITTTTTTSVIDAQLKGMIDQGVIAALVACDADRNTNGDDSHTSGMGVRRTERVARECTYQDFMKCQPLYFKGTEGVVELTQWFERMKTVFRISHSSMENQIKFSTCTLLACALTWWNSQVRIVGHDVAYAMTWTELKKKMTDNLIKLKELMDKKISMLAECQAKNKRKLDSNNQAQQQSPKSRMRPKLTSLGLVKEKSMLELYRLWQQYKFQSTLAHAQKMLKLQEGRSSDPRLSDCPELKNQNHGNQAGGTGSRGVVHTLGGGETDQDLNKIEDEIEA
ncbi:hypothetical protein Tco_0014653 [Tanacetum coccineum]